MARQLHRVIEVDGFTPDDDFADLGTPPPWDPIELHPGCTQITWWVRPYDGDDPLTAAQVPAANATLDAELVFFDGVEGGGYSRSAEITNSSNAAHWAGSPPVTAQATLDRLAAQVYALGGNTPIS